VLIGIGWTKLVIGARTNGAGLGVCIGCSLEVMDDLIAESGKTWDFLDVSIGAPECGGRIQSEPLFVFGGALLLRGNGCGGGGPPQKVRRALEKARLERAIAASVEAGEAVTAPARLEAQMMV